MVAAGTTFLLVTGLLAVVQWRVEPPMLLAERFVPGAGWAEVLALGLYAAFVVRRMADPRRAPVWRRRVWRLFSAVFFGQLVLGLLGVERCLMTGKLHFPIPALIVAGPLYRGGGYFMLGLFLTTVVLVGPAWCSHLCYVGAWDDVAATRRARPQALPRWSRWGKVAFAALVFGSAFALGRLGVPAGTAAVLAALFGIAAVGVMVGVSRRLGAMTHCLFWCPIGVLATRLGRISPFRLRIREGCGSCGLCTRVCRYDALTPADLATGRPGPSCTLCGDCVHSCRTDLLRYHFPGLSPARARTLFLVLTVSLHALFLGLARI